MRSASWEGRRSPPGRKALVSQQPRQAGGQPKREGMPGSSLWNTGVGRKPHRGMWGGDAIADGQEVTWGELSISMWDSR